MDSDTTVYELVDKRPNFCNENLSIQEAAKQMKDSDIGALMVRDANEKTVGIITERDFLNKILAENKSATSTKVKDIMTMPVLTIPLHASPEAAIEVMIKGNIRHLPMKSGQGEVIGIISIRDLLKKILQDYRELQKRGEKIISKKHGDILKKN